MQGTRNKLVKRWLDHKDSAEFKKALGRKQAGKGIYILYKNDTPYYVGLSTSSIRGRLRKHMRDRLAGKWNNFSMYQIRKTKYIKDVESLLLQYYKPEGNRVKGRFRSRYRIKD